jgi:ATP-binding cassette subfamily B protein
LKGRRHAPPAAAPELARCFFGVFGYSRRALQLVWTTSPRLSISLGMLKVMAGMLPAADEYVAALIIDAVDAAIQAGPDRGELTTRVLLLVTVEGLLVAAIAGMQRGISLCQSLLRAQLGQRVNSMILEKALTLELSHFEDSEFYDKLTRARREASSRPLSLVMRTFGLLQNGISLVSYGTLLAQFSPWAVVILVAAGLPAFLAEAKFSGTAFRLFLWRSPETRMQLYLETVLAREDHAKEVKLFGLGPLLLERYRGIFRKLYAEDRDLTIRRDTWGFLLGLIATATLYGAYAWVALATIAARITLGQMTMYVMLFRQGQAAVSASLAAIGGMYEDNLYLATLYEYLETPVDGTKGTVVRGPRPQDGIRFENVSFSYPGAEQPALVAVDLHIKPGESLALVGENGSGKTTLIKLLTKLYLPTSGRILLDGQDLRHLTCAGDVNGDATRRIPGCRSRRSPTCPSCPTRRARRPSGRGGSSTTRGRSSPFRTGRCTGGPRGDRTTRATGCRRTSHAADLPLTWLLPRGGVHLGSTPGQIAHGPPHCVRRGDPI